MANDELQNVDPDDINDWLLQVEKSFAIQFTQNEFNEVQTFGELSDHIVNKLSFNHTDDCTTQQAFYKLRSALATVLYIEPITPHTLLADILPRQSRRHDVKRLADQLGFNLPILSPPSFVVASLLAFCLVSLLGAFHQFGLLGLTISVAGLWFAFKFGKELTVKTVGELITQITRENYTKVRRNTTTYNRNEIEKLLADWICECFAISRAKLTRSSKLGW